MKDGRILITGSEGYLGQHLVQYIRKSNINVVASHRNELTSQYPLNFSEPEKISISQIADIDTMIHTVPLNEQLYKKNRYAALSQHIAGIHAALDFCIYNQIPNFIYFSSFHVFGNQSGTLHEQQPPSPTNDYGLAHFIAEQTVNMFNRTKKVNGWIIRPSNVFGVPYDIEVFKRWSLIPFLFCAEAVSKGEITLHSPGHQLRNFVHVTDVCRLVMYIIETKPDNRKFHAFGSETISVIQYAMLVKKVAEEQFNMPIKINQPRGTDDIIQFSFESIEHPISPTKELEEFVKEMLIHLLKSKGEDNDYDM